HRKPVGPRGGGYLARGKPWPSTLRPMYGDPARSAQNYWSRHPGKYFSGGAGIARPSEIKGCRTAAFCRPKEGIQSSDKLKDELKNHVATKIGSIAKPDDIFFTAELPKTRSAKIMRRLLRDIAEGRVLGDTTTLADPSVIAKLKEQAKDEG